MTPEQVLEKSGGRRGGSEGKKTPEQGDGKKALVRDIVIRIAGNSQDGIQSVGEFLARHTGRSQLGVLTFQTFPATISGGPSIFQFRIGTGKVRSPGDDIDVLVAFYQHSYQHHIPYLREGGILLYDSDHVEPATHDQRYRQVAIPISSLTIEAIGGNAKSKGKNMFLLGLLSRVLGFETQELENQIKQRFGSKGDEVVRPALQAFHAGYGYDLGDLSFYLEKNQDRAQKQVTSNGNQALVLGAIAAGVRFGAGYPITPWSTAMELFRQELPKYGGIFVQAEDELSAISMALGASIADRVSVTGSSGPGLALKSEVLGYAVMAEIGLVIVDVMRGGPSTGLPTKVEQSDLFHAVFGGHGDAPRVVIAPYNVADCFHAMVEAVNIAREYRVPVIFLTDQGLGTRIETWQEPDLAKVMVDMTPKLDAIPRGYLPYQDLEKGVPRAYVPGTHSLDGRYPVVTGLEHNEAGHPDGGPANHMRMTAKRRRKLQMLAQSLPAPKIYGDEEGEALLVSWGSSWGPVQEAIDQARGQGRKMGGLPIRFLSPLPVGLKEIFARYKHIYVVELNDCGIYNFGGQLATVLRSVLCDDRIRGINKTDGLALKVREILGQVDYLMGRRQTPGIVLDEHPDEAGQS